MSYTGQAHAAEYDALVVQSTGRPSLRSDLLRGVFHTAALPIQQTVNTCCCERSSGTSSGHAHCLEQGIFLISHVRPSGDKIHRRVLSSEHRKHVV